MVCAVICASEIYILFPPRDGWMDGWMIVDFELIYYDIEPCCLCASSGLQDRWMKVAKLSIICSALQRQNLKQCSYIISELFSLSGPSNLDKLNSPDPQEHQEFSEFGARIR